MPVILLLQVRPTVLKPLAMSTEFTPQAFTPKSELVCVLSERGHLHQCTNLEGLDAAASAGIVTAYIGYDATAPSLHVGNMATIMLLRRLQKAGHRPIVLTGGATTKVGDPSGKDTTRPLLTDELINANIASQKRAFAHYLQFGDGPTDASVVNNADWIEPLGYLDFLRTYGTHFTINRMLSFDSVKLRLDREQPLTFLEFNYMLVQAVDFLELNRRQGVVLQMGGSDQWGNIVNGVELIRRVDGKEAFGLTTPLITTSSGVKMGKTASGAVWLNGDLLSPYDYWQFWRNTEDADVGRFLRLFTDLPLDEIARLEALEGAEINEAKKILANAATALCRGEEASRLAAETARKTFEEGASGDALPRVSVPGGRISLVAALTTSGLAASGGEAKRKIGEGAVRVNDSAITDASHEIILTEPETKLSLGKKKHAILIPA